MSLVIQRQSLQPGGTYSKIWFPKSFTLNTLMPEFFSETNATQIDIFGDSGVRLDGQWLYDSSDYGATLYLSWQNESMLDEWDMPLSFSISYTTEDKLTWNFDVPRTAMQNNPEYIYESSDQLGYYIDISHFIGRSFTLPSTSPYSVWYIGAVSYQDMGEYDIYSKFKYDVEVEVIDPEPTPTPSGDTTTVDAVFSDIADSIRTKLGTSAGIKPVDMADLILTISGDTPTPTPTRVSITGDYNFNYKTFQNIDVFIPKTMTFQEPIETHWNEYGLDYFSAYGSVELYIQWNNGSISYDWHGMEMEEGGSISIYYTSNDGLTYTLSTNSSLINNYGTESADGTGYYIDVTSALTASPGMWIPGDNANQSYWFYNGTYTKPSDMGNYNPFCKFMQDVSE